MLIGRVKDRRINVTADRFSRMLTVFIEQVVADGSGKLLKLSGPIVFEAAKEDGSMI